MSFIYDQFLDFYDSTVPGNGSAAKTLTATLADSSVFTGGLRTRDYAVTIANPSSSGANIVIGLTPTGAAIPSLTNDYFTEIVAPGGSYTLTYSTNAGEVYLLSSTASSVTAAFSIASVRSMPTQ